MRLTIIHYVLSVCILGFVACNQETVNPVVPAISFIEAGVVIDENSATPGMDTITTPVVAVLSQPVSTDIVVSLAITGSAIRNVDYVIKKDTLRFPAGSVACTTYISIVNDSDVEPEKSIVLMIAASVPGIVISGALKTCTIAIHSDDTPRVGVVHYNRTVSRRSGSFPVQVFLDRAGFDTISVPYVVTGSAKVTEQHDFVSGIFVFLPGDTLEEKIVHIVNDSTMDGFKSLVVTLGVPSNASKGDYIIDSTTVAYDKITAFQLMDNEIPTWKQSAFDSEFRVLQGDDLYTAINGGATPYVDFHYQIALRQTLTRQVVKTNAANPVRLDTVQHELLLMAMRFNTVADVDSIFSQKVGTLDSSSIVSVAGYGSSNVAGNYSIAGAVYYIRFNTMYFELSVSLPGFPEQVDSIVKSVVDWINLKAH